jgi:uncharacterized protein with NAD-binding domain and iron-sulfur cluster
MSESKKKRAVVLGAGPAGLSAAMALIESGDYEVHVYQMGWRAGGKCATGRDAVHFRTRQNGSHYLFGCYHNSFALIRRAHRVLAESGAPDKADYGSFFDDFVARNLLVGAQGYKRKATSQPDQGLWLRYLPQNMACPGEGGKFATPFDYALMAAQYALGTAIDLLVGILDEEGDENPLNGCRICLWLLPVSPFETSRWSKIVRAALTPCRWLFNQLWYGAAWLMRKWMVLLVILTPTWGIRFARSNWKRLIFGLVAFLRELTHGAQRVALEQNQNLSRGLQRLVILFELMLAGTVGFITDELWRAGSFEKIDDEDLRDWLKRHGASEYAYKSSLVRTWYDATIAYEDGDEQRAFCSAGVALQAMLRSLLTYKGAFAFQMRAEVGDSYIAPVVRALELLGVKFHFYHRVKELRVSSKTRSVESIVLAQQVAAPPTEAELMEMQYGPDKARRRRRAWPAASRQPATAGAPFPLDSYYSQCEHQRFELKRERDFDVVVCALPVGVVEDVLIDEARGTPLSQVDGPYRELFRNIKLTESQAIRMWFKVPLAGLGWRHEPPILSGTDWPHSTWEDNSQSTEIQNFPEVDRPLTIATLFGPLATGKSNVRDPAHYAAQVKAAEAAARSFIFGGGLLRLWPGLCHSQPLPALPALPASRSSAAASPIDWSKFIDLDQRSGEDRFGWQLICANVGPNESYIVTTPGSLKYRPRPDESGYQHLYLAGDWTRNGVQAGTVEGAVMSGLKAAFAITGKGEAIVGGDDFDNGSVFS